MLFDWRHPNGPVKLFLYNILHFIHCINGNTRLTLLGLFATFIELRFYLIQAKLRDVVLFNKDSLKWRLARTIVLPKEGYKLLQAMISQEILM